jgi:amino acid adenylation domain-containing protein
MSVISLISKLKDSKIRVNLAGDELKISAPSGKLNSQLLDEIRRNKVQIIEFLQQIPKQASYEPIPLAPSQDYYELSSSQKRLWIFDQVSDYKTVYNIPNNYIINERIDELAFKSAFKSLVERHEILRTIFVMIEGEPFQKICDSHSLPFHVEYFDYSANADGEVIAQKIGVKDANTSFDLKLGPLLRTKLIKVQDDRYYFILTIHHIISDGWSIEVLIKELFALYHTCREAKNNPLVPLRIQFKDYAQWSNKKLTGSSFNRHRDYWLKNLAGELQVLKLPTDFPRPAIQTFNGASSVTSTNREILDRLTGIYLGKETSLFMVLVAALKVLFYRYTGQCDIIIGTPIAGRDHSDLENQIGNYLNTLALRTIVEGSESFESVLAKVKNTTLNAFEHQLFPFETLVEELGVKRESDRSPLFDVMVVFQAAGPARTSGRNSIEQFDVPKTISAFDLTFFLNKTDSGLTISVEYNTDLFQESTISRMLNHYKKLLESIAHGAESKICDLNYLTDQELSHLIVELNQTKADFPKGKTIYGLIAEQVTRTPDRVAVSYGANALTYAQLIQNAENISQVLKNKFNVGSGDLVGLLLNRSENMVVAMLSILKTGAAYVPIDPDYPFDRISYILEDSAIKILLTTREFVHKADSRIHDRCILKNYILLDEVLSKGHERDQAISDTACLDRNHLSSKNGVLSLDNEKHTDLACIFYTSGSTGKPKGVCITRDNVLAFISWCQKEFRESNYEVVYAVTSFCFDLSVFEIFFPLTIGKPIKILNTAQEIGALLKSDKAVLINTVPSVVSEMLKSKIDMSNLAVLNMAGEPVPEYFRDDLDYKDIEIRNLYGPSEDTTYSTCYRFQDSHKNILIGKPVSNTNIYIVDENLSLLPKGFIGELCISGTGLCMGYLNKSELTESKFVNNPFNDGYDRLYHTGDLARWLPDGNLEFKGRKDDQLKINGYRIEPGEIESVLKGHPKVQQAIVLCQENESKSLVAYFTRKFGEEKSHSVMPPLDELNPIVESNLPDEEYVFNEVDFPQDRAAFELFETAVNRFPERIAVISGLKRLTYLQLNENANQLAAILLQRGLSQENIVGIIMQRSEAMLETILAIWKCGAAYLPIDPGYAAERINLILKESAAKFIITDNASINKQSLKDIGEVIEIVALEKIAEQRSKASKLNPEVAFGSRQLSYVIFTSGSTGRPKGAMIEHIGMVNHLFSKINELGLNSSSVVAQNASHTFDISVWQFFSALLVGGTTIIYSNEIVLDVENFIEKIQTDSVTILEVVPSYLEVMLELLTGQANNQLSSLQYLLVTGEVLKRHLVALWFSLKPGIKMVNAYGPTEASDDITHYVMDALPDYNHIPLGKVIQNLRIYIVDEIGNICPKGVTGEICVSGVGVGRGYINDETRTKRAFVTDPFSGNEQRMYKTGDLGRYNAENLIEYAGRKDLQIKIRGFRIELEEIEVKIQEINGVKQVAVVVKEDGHQNKYLSCYLVVQSAITKSYLIESLTNSLPEYMVPAEFSFLEELPLTSNGKVNRKFLSELQDDDSIVQDIRIYLKECLPLYMIPSRFIMLDKFPLNPNGKIDRKALLETPQKIKQKEFLPIQTHTERKLLAIWEAVLDKKEISADANFFEIGGHSLKATQVLSRIHKQFEVKMELKDIFLEPTIEKLALAIDKHGKQEYVRINRIEAASYYEMSHAQKRLWILNQLQPESTAYNMSGAYLFEGQFDNAALQFALERLNQRHEILRTNFKIINGEPKAFVHKIEERPFLVDFIELINYSDPEQRAARLIEEENKRPFNLESDFLIRAKSVLLNSQRNLLILSMHHIISDGWSVGILINELFEEYNAHFEKRPSSLPPLKIQYKDFAAWQNNQLEGDNLVAHQQYWWNRLQGDLPILQLPLFKKKPPVQTFNGLTKRFILPAELSSKIKSLATANDASLFMTLIGVLNVLFYKYTGQKDIIMGTSVAGRNHEDLENQIGFFINTLALRTEFLSTDTFRGLLKNVKQEILGAYEHQIYPFDRLVEELKVERDMSRSAIFDVLVELQNFQTTDSSSSLKHGELNVKQFGTESLTSIFDLNFVFHDLKDGLLMEVRYNTDVFLDDQIDMLYKHFAFISAQIAQSPDLQIKKYDILLEEERILLAKFNDTSKDYDKSKTAVSLIEEQVLRKKKTTTAVGDETQAVSYHHLSKISNQVARFLTNGKVRPEDVVALLMDRSSNMIEAILAVWKAAACYLPLDPSLPEDRIKYMVENAEVKVLISEKKYLRQAYNLQWEVQGLNDLFFWDTDTIYQEKEEKLNETMDKDLWEYVGKVAKDEIEGGGWFSSYTGEALTQAEMDEYASNILLKLQPHLTPETKVLEIGCASGISMFKISPYVKEYHGTDMSDIIIETNRRKVRDLKISNIRLSRLFAHEISTLDESFDVIIINSVIQNFHGYNYLRNVIEKSISLIGDKGILFIGDVMDHDSKPALIKSLNDFSIANQGKGYVTKTEWSSELFVSRNFFNDLQTDFPVMREVAFSDKIGTIENELTLFRYDAIFRIDKNKTSNHHPVSKIKNQFDRKILDSYSFDAIDLSRPEQLSYIIYTSGSTGQPKGVMVEHIGMANHLQSKIHDLNLDSNSIIIQNASQSFDISVWQMFAALLVGGKTVVYGKDLIHNPEAFIQKLEEDQVTILEVVPSYLSLLLDCIPSSASSFGTLKYLMITGEIVQPSLVKHWFESFPNIHLVNAYGPTEASDDITHFIMESMPSSETISIGKPIENMRIYVINEDLQQCPIGIKGELCVSGVGVGRGYLNDPIKTDASFINNPFEDSAESCLYKTGDLARFLSDGTIEFYGRKDNQVKIQGNRIELGEIEHTLTKIDGVSSAAVLDYENHKGGKYLRGYITVSRRNLQIEEVQQKLRALLPSIMVPSQMTIVDKLPLTSNGKIDRKALRSAETKKNDHVKEPKTEMEIALADIWKQVLNVERVSTTDNFFEAGGNSIRLVKLWHQINGKLKTQSNSSLPKKIDLADLFVYTTLEDQAQFVIQKGIDGISSKFLSSKFRIQSSTSNSKVDAFFMPPFSGLSLCYLGLMNLIDNQVNGFLFNYRGLAEHETPFTSFKDLISFYTNEVTSSSCGSPVILVGYSSGGNLVFEIARSLERSGIRPTLFIIESVPVNSLNKEEESHNKMIEFVDSYTSALETSMKEYFTDSEFLVRYKASLLGFIRIWDNLEVSADKIASDIYLFARGEEAVEYQAWRDHTTGQFTFTSLPKGDHDTLLNHADNINIIASQFTDLWRIIEL